MNYEHSMRRKAVTGKVTQAVENKNPRYVSVSGGEVDLSQGRIVSEIGC